MTVSSLEASCQQALQELFNDHLWVAGICLLCTAALKAVEITKGNDRAKRDGLREAGRLLLPRRKIDFARDPKSSSHKTQNQVLTRPKKSSSHETQNLLLARPNILCPPNSLSHRDLCDMTYATSYSRLYAVSFLLHDRKSVCLRRRLQQLSFAPAKSVSCFCTVLSILLYTVIHTCLHTVLPTLLSTLLFTHTSTHTSTHISTYTLLHTLLLILLHTSTHFFLQTLLHTCQDICLASPTHSYANLLTSFPLYTSTQLSGRA